MEIRAVNLTRVFSDGGQRVVALSGATLSFSSGQMVVLLGPSGSGKTTLLNLLSGLDVPTDGAVFLDKRPYSALSDQELSLLRNRSFGFIFQFFNLLPEFTVLENVCIPALVAGYKLTGAQERAEMLLAKLGLTERKSAFPGELSGGEQQRVAVARALINNPAFVFADEPTGNLDPDNAALCLELFSRILQKNGTGFIIATHNSEIAQNASFAIRLKNGKIIATESANH